MHKLFHFIKFILSHLNIAIEFYIEKIKDEIKVIIYTGLVLAALFVVLVLFVVMFTVVLFFRL